MHRDSEKQKGQKIRDNDHPGIPGHISPKAKNTSLCISIINRTGMKLKKSNLHE